MTDALAQSEREREKERERELLAEKWCSSCASDTGSVESTAGPVDQWTQLHWWSFRPLVLLVSVGWVNFSFPQLHLSLSLSLRAYFRIQFHSLRPLISDWYKRVITQKEWESERERERMEKGEKKAKEIETEFRLTVSVAGRQSAFTFTLTFMHFSLLSLSLSLFLSSISKSDQWSFIPCLQEYTCEFSWHYYCLKPVYVCYVCCWFIHWPHAKWKMRRRWRTKQEVNSCMNIAMNTGMNSVVWTQTHTQKEVVLASVVALVVVVIVVVVVSCCVLSYSCISDL